MKITVDMTGMEEAMKEINEGIEKVEGDIKAGLWEAGLKIMRRSQQHLADSVITGNLRASGYVRSAAELEKNPASVSVNRSKGKRKKNLPVPKDQLGLGVELGFTANYALWAHEYLGGRAPKFLERVIVENKQAIIDIVRERTQADG